MQLSTNTRYAIRLIYELYLIKSPISISTIAERINVSSKIVETLHATLKQSGITRSIIGAHGGIELSRKLESVSLGEMIDLFDNGVRFVVCFGNKSNNCPKQAACETQSVWRVISNRIREQFNKISLADILDEYREDLSKEKPITIHCLNHKGEMIFN